MEINLDSYYKRLFQYNLIVTKILTAPPPTNPIKKLLYWSMT